MEMIDLGNAVEYIYVNNSTFLDPCCTPNLNRKSKLVIALAVVLIGITTIIACIAGSYHKIHEGNVGVYYKYGALQV